MMNKLLKNLGKLFLISYLGFNQINAQNKINLNPVDCDTSSIYYKEVESFLLSEIRSKEAYEALSPDSLENITLNLVLTPLSQREFRIGGNFGRYDPIEDIVTQRIFPIKNYAVAMILAENLIHELKHKYDIGPENKDALFLETKEHYKKVRNREIKDSSDDKIRLIQRIELEKRAYDASIRYCELKMKNSDDEERINVYRELIEAIKIDKEIITKELEEKLSKL